jgi:ATP-dependent RNA helicase RhlE
VPETYVHRIGRTGRAGSSGLAISFCDRTEREYLRDIIKLTGKDIAVISEHPYSANANEPVAPKTQSSRRPDQRNRNKSNFGRSKNAQRA